MKKNYILICLILILLTGCENQNENIKSEYIAMKNQAFSNKNYFNEQIPVEITSTIERSDAESINYKVIIDNPKENMHKIKAIVVHNYYNEDVFPSVGLFDETRELLINDDKESKLILKDTIKSTKNINDLNLQLKIWIEYINDDGEKKDIYYKTT